MVTQDSSHFSLEIIKKRGYPIKKNKRKMAFFVNVEKGSSNVLTIVISELIKLETSANTHMTDDL